MKYKKERDGKKYQKIKKPTVNKASKKGKRVSKSEKQLQQKILEGWRAMEKKIHECMRV